MSTDTNTAAQAKEQTGPPILNFCVVHIVRGQQLVRTIEEAMPPNEAEAYAECFDRTNGRGERAVVVRQTVLADLPSDIDQETGSPASENGPLELGITILDGGKATRSIVLRDPRVFWCEIVNSEHQDDDQEAVFGTVAPCGVSK